MFNQDHQFDRLTLRFSRQIMAVLSPLKMNFALSHCLGRIPTVRLIRDLSTKSGHV